MKSQLLLTGLTLLSTINSSAADSCSSKNDSQESAQKNILFIAVDDMKPLLGCYGDPIALTPNIDRLASQGTLFTSAYCQQAISGPSRASLLTGMLPDRTRVWDLKTYIRDENPDVVTLPQYFKQNGYTVAGIGKIYDPRTVDKGYDYKSWSTPFLKNTDYLNESCGDPAMASYQKKETKALYDKYKAEGKAKGLKGGKLSNYIRKRIKPSTECVDMPDDAYFDGGTLKGAIQFLDDYKSNKPFFLAVGFKKPHLPFVAPKKYWDMYNRAELPLASYRKRAENTPKFVYHTSGELMSYTDIPDLASFSDIANLELQDDKARELIHGYYACISYVDALIGKLIDDLKAKGLDKNTIIVLWGDHGWHLGDHGLWNKHSNFEQATRVPLMIVDPSAQPKKVDAPVGFIDVYPTLCDMAGLKEPAHLDGKTLLPFIEDAPTEVAQLKPYAVSQYPRWGKMGYSFRDKRYRYTIWIKRDDNKKVDTNKVYLEELYDYDKDPDETVNVADKAEYQNVIKRMRTYWNEYSQTHIPNKL